MKVNRVTEASLALPDSFKTVTLRIQTLTLWTVENAHY